MAKDTITTTASHIQVASGECVITILDRGNGTLFINETATDTDANRYGSADLKVSDQISQNSAVATFVRGTGTKPWVLLIDGTI